MKSTMKVDVLLLEISDSTAKFLCSKVTSSSLRFLVFDVAFPNRKALHQKIKKGHSAIPVL